MTGDPSKRSRRVAGRITNRGEHEDLVMKLGLKRGHDMLYLGVTGSEARAPAALISRGWIYPCSACAVEPQELGGGARVLEVLRSLRLSGERLRPGCCLCSEGCSDAATAHTVASPLNETSASCQANPPNEKL